MYTHMEKGQEGTIAKFDVGFGATEHLTLIFRPRNDMSPSSAHPGNASKTLKNFINIAGVNVKSFEERVHHARG